MLLHLKKNIRVHIFIKNAFFAKKCSSSSEPSGRRNLFAGEGLALSLWETPCSAKMPADDAAAPGREHRGLGGALC